jgi:pyruvate,water dikinase
VLRPEEIAATELAVTTAGPTTSAPAPAGSPSPDERPAGPLHGVVLHGIAASSGVVRGRARVALTPEEGMELEPGEVLVAPFTDPGWTPLFTIAGAIVMDLGGLLSHGAIVAREYGIPAVVNTRTATAALRTGQEVTVDGDRGEVRW